VRLGFLTLAAIWTFFVAGSTASDAAEFSGLVRSVVDGDDIELCADGGPCRDVRLCGIDAPEAKCGRSYEVARNALRALVDGKQVRCIQVGGAPLAMEGRSQRTETVLSRSASLTAPMSPAFSLNEALRAIGKSFQVGTIRAMAKAVHAPWLIALVARQYYRAANRAFAS
jgi:antitoxin (DNA-binding transcriptional repressor) of toxin-antitoxin stability system